MTSQRVSVGGATTIAGRVAAPLGEAIDAGDGALTRLALTPDAYLGAGADVIASLAMPGRGVHTLVSVAAAVRGGRLHLEPGASTPDAREALLGGVARVAPESRPGAWMKTGPEKVFRYSDRAWRQRRGAQARNRGWSVREHVTDERKWLKSHEQARRRENIETPSMAQLR